MAKARKIKTGYWVVSYRDESGKGRSRSFGKGREAADKAKKFAAKIDYSKAYDEPLPLNRGEGVYVDQLCQLWTDDLRARGKGARWLTDWLSTFNEKFSPALWAKPVHQITLEDVVKIISEHYSTHSQSTRNRYMRYLKGIFQYGVNQKHLRENPMASWKSGREPRRKSPLTLEAFQAIMRNSPPHLAWALEVAWNIPCRPGPSDLFALRFDKHYQPGRGGVEVFHTKVGRWAFILLDEEFMRSLAIRQKQHASGYLIEYKGKPVTDIGVGLAGAAKRAGLPYRPCLYDVRHLWITTALDNGHEPSAIAYVAGTSVEMIHEHYYEPHAAERSKIAATMPKVRAEEPEKGRKVVGIDGSNVVKSVVKNAGSKKRSRTKN
jgi:integrase